MNIMPYNGTLTAEQFLFCEMRIVSKQCLENKSIEEIITYIWCYVNKKYKSNSWDLLLCRQFCG